MDTRCTQGCQKLQVCRRGCLCRLEIQNGFGCQLLHLLGRDCRPTAAWVGMQWSPEAWQAWEHRSSCDLFNLLPGLTAVATAHDFMHSKYLGTDMVFLAGCFWLLCYRMLEGSPLDNLKVCWEKLAQVYKEKKILDRHRGMNKLSVFERKKEGQK